MRLGPVALDFLGTFWKENIFYRLLLWTLKWHILYVKQKRNDDLLIFKIIDVIWRWNLHCTFFYKEKFYKKMGLKNPKTLRKCLENPQPQMPELKFLKTLIFPRDLQKLQNWVNCSFFLSLKFFCFSIIKKRRLLLVLNLIK